MLPAEKSILVSEPSSTFLDFLRGTAAIAVVAGHLRYLFFNRFEELATKPRLAQGIYFLASFGHVSVVIFFVLSGFWISSGILRRPLSDFDPGRYVIQRLSRLYIVLIPALLLGVLLDGYGLHSPTLSATYLHPLPQFGDWTPNANFTFREFFGNLFFLQVVKTQTFGSNSPLWSLSYEFWYYVLFPLNLWALFASDRHSRLLGIGFTIAVIFLLPRIILQYYPVWLQGVFPVYFFRNHGVSRGALSAASGTALSLFFLGLIFVCRAGYFRFGEYPVDFAIALATLGLVTTVARTRFKSIPTGYRRFSKFLADFSFTTYLVHMPVLVMLKAIFLPDRKLDPSLATFAYGIAILLFTLSMTYLFSRFTENRTAEVRRYFERKFLRHT